MKLKSLLNKVSAILSMVYSTYATEFNIEIKNYDEYCVKFNNITQTFINIPELSQGVKNLQNAPLNLDSIRIDKVKFNTLVFDNVKSTQPCIFSIQSKPNLKPNIIINCAENQKLSFDKIKCNNIYSIRVNSRSKFEINNIMTKKQNEDPIKSKKKFDIVGAFCIGNNSYSEFEFSLNA